MIPLTDQDLNRLERANYRRTSFLTMLTLVWFYVVGDVLLRFGLAQNIEILRLLNRLIPEGVFGQICVFILSALVVWVVFYLADARFQQAGAHSWMYRLGNLEHSRPFNTVFLILLLALAGLATQYQLSDTAFWLLWTLVLLSCVINYIEPTPARRTPFAWYGLRLRLLLHRVPYLGRRFVRLNPITRQMETPDEQNTPPAEAPPTSPPPGPDQPATPPTP